MMKTEPSSAKTANPTALRSPSPHRNAYEASIQALKPAANDILSNAANGDAQDGKPRQSSRGRTYGSNVHRIKNMFMQMGASSPTEGEDPGKASESDKPVRLTLPRAGSLNENVDHSALLKLGATVSERVNKFDPKAEGSNGQQRGVVSPSSSASSSFSKLQETRKIFEQTQQQERQGVTGRVLLKKERVAGIQDGRLDVVARFNGSTESLDSLDAVGGATEAVSPTVSQLSAVFERAAELRNNLHRLSNTPPLPSRGVTAKPGTLNSKIIAKRVRGFPAGSNREDASNQNQNQRQQDGTKNQGSLTTDGFSSAADGHPRAAEWAENGTGVAGSPPEANAQQAASEVTRASRGVHSSPIENGKETFDRNGAHEGEDGEVTGRAAGGWRRGGDGEEQQKEGNQLDISTYSAAGEESAGSQEEEEEEEDEAYEPESSCTEITGLPPEDETPPSRKIRFSTGPIKVSLDLFSTRAGAGAVPVQGRGQFGTGSSTSTCPALGSAR